TTGAAAAAIAAMIPISNVVRTEWKTGSPSLVRYNGYEAIDIVGGPAQNKSTGEAVAAMQDLVKQLPPGFDFDWTGQSLQEILSGNEASLLFALSILVVFLCLAALYESWSVPVAVMLVVPLGVTGAFVVTSLRHLGDAALANDVYFKIGLLTIIGL